MRPRSQGRHRTVHAERFVGLSGAALGHVARSAGTTLNARTISMADLSQIKEHAEVIGADGVHVGTVDHVQGDRLKLTKKDSGDERHHYIPGGLVAEVEGDKVRLSANADVAVTFEETE
jgi:hypothetical protein